MVVSPIAGASVSSDGFVVFLSYTASGRYFEEDMYIQAVVSCVDTDVVKSPEALTLLQLMQGIDMATPLLPPDALQRAYVDVGSVLLSEVHCYPPADVRNCGDAMRGSDADLFAGKKLEISPEQTERREAKMQQRAPDLVKALKTVNVVVDLKRAMGLLRVYSSEEGDLDRNGFADSLAAARVPTNLKLPESLPTFTLVAVTDDSVGKEVNVSAFVGLSLHLRHKAPIVVKGGRRAPGDEKDVELSAESWDRYSFDAADVASLYPQWRSIEAIAEEGEAMSKRTVQLFQEAKKAKLLEDLTKYTPLDFLGKNSGDGEDPVTSPTKKNSDRDDGEDPASPKPYDIELLCGNEQIVKGDVKSVVAKMKKDLEEAEAAGAAALPKAVAEQEVLSDIASTFMSKLNKISSSSTDKLGKI